MPLSAPAGRPGRRPAIGLAARPAASFAFRGVAETVFVPPATAAERPARLAIVLSTAGVVALSAGVLALRGMVGLVLLSASVISGDA
ncbi:hypothetical protein C7T35_08435 [Variovorax sp. WS11]|nr:hypothetical protein C7T35_08435 [Variovorax sp. WS11]